MIPADLGLRLKKDPSEPQVTPAEIEAEKLCDGFKTMLREALYMPCGGGPPFLNKSTGFAIEPEALQK